MRGVIGKIKKEAVTLLEQLSAERLKALIDYL